MSTDSIDQELNSHDRGIVEAADRVWQRIAGESGHYEDWNMVRDALMVGRQYAMRALHIQEPRGRGYNDLFGRWRARHFPKMAPGTCSSLLFLASPENRMVVDDLRRAMSDTERMQVWHPDSMAKRVRRFLKDHGDAARKRRIADGAAQGRECRLKRQVASQADGSLFDFHRDTIEDIATVMIGASRSRAERIAGPCSRRYRSRRVDGRARHRRAADLRGRSWCARTKSTIARGSRTSMAAGRIGRSRPLQISSTGSCLPCQRVRRGPSKMQAGRR